MSCLPHSERLTTGFPAPLLFLAVCVGEVDDEEDEEEEEEEEEDKKKLVRKGTCMGVLNWWDKVVVWSVMCVS